MGTVACRINTVRTACLFPPFLYSFKEYFFFLFCVMYNLSFHLWLYQMSLSLALCNSFYGRSHLLSSQICPPFGVWFERMFLESIRFVPLRAFLKRCEVVGYTFNSKTVDLFCELLKALVINECSCASFIRRSCCISHFLSTFESFPFCIWCGLKALWWNMGRILRKYDQERTFC